MNSSLADSRDRHPNDLEPREAALACQRFGTSTAALTSLYVTQTRASTGKQPQRDLQLHLQSGSTYMYLCSTDE